MSSSSSSPSSSSTDAAFLNILKQYTSSGLGGELRFTDAFFSFLRRHTSLLNNPQAVQQVQNLAMKHVHLKQQQNTNKTTTAASTSASPPANAAAPSTNPPTHSPPSSGAVSPTAPASVDSSVVEEKKQESIPVNNGGLTDRYTWSQSLSDVTAIFPISASLTSKQLQVTITSTNLTILNKVTNTPIIATQPFHAAVVADDATWTIESDGSNKHLTVYLPKVNRMSWWSCLLEGDPIIDVTKINPENSSLSDLDASTRQTVEKMMFDQRAKASGGKTSDELQKEQALKRFMDMHPEMDFSQAKIM